MVNGKQQAFLQKNKNAKQQAARLLY